MKKNGYNTAARNYAAFAVATWWSPAVSFSFAGLAAQSRQKAITYNDAAHWLGQANMNWKRFIGARQDLMVPDGYYCECFVNLGGNNGYTYTQSVVQDSTQCDAAAMGALYCSYTTKYKHVIIDEDSDGVVPVSSQTGYPGARIGLEMIETNHMQQRNCTQTKLRLMDLFEGFYGPEFQLDEI